MLHRLRLMTGGELGTAEVEDEEVVSVGDLASNKGITILQWNCRSLYHKLDEIIHINKDSQGDVCIYTESWMTPNIPTGMVSLAGYNIFRQDRDPKVGKSRGGGILIYIRDHLKATLVENGSLCSKAIEVMTIKLDLKCVREIYIICVYRPPDGPVNEFVSEVDRIIGGLSSKVNIEVNLVGDVNIDLRKRNPQVKLYRDLLRRHDLVNVIKTDTHYTANSGNSSLIDHFATNNIGLYNQAGVCPTDESDHYIIFASRKKFKVRRNKEKIRARRYKSLNEETFARDIEEHDWSQVLRCDDPSEAWDRFVEEFNAILDEHAPWKIMYFTEDLPEWATREMLALCRARDHLKSRAIRTGDPVHAEQARKARNNCNQFKRNLRQDYYLAAFEQAGRDSKKLWKVVKQLFGSRKGKNRLNSINGKVEPVDMANEINDFFSDIGPRLAEGIPESLLDIDLEFREDRELFHFHEIEDSDISKIMSSISSNKSTGVDGIPIRFLKMCHNTVCTILKHIVNQSLKTRVVPEGWKIACLTPLYKEGDRDQPGNYRPVSILPAASKILEKVVHKQVSEYLERYKVLSEAQFGFRKNHSTATCVINFINDIYINMDEGRLTGVVFLDLKKAFDTVDHSILLRKLTMYGLSNEAVEWFASYLRGRMQYTKVNGKLSGKREIRCGVPQGSILGPMLFLVYVNDLSRYLGECKTSLYADDTTVYCSSHSYVDIVLALRIEASNIIQWLRANKLTLNVSKTKFMVFGTRQKLKNVADIPLHADGEVIERVQHFKYLGVILDETLSFEEHIDTLYRKTCSKMGAIKKARTCINQDTALMLYKSLVLPHLDYLDIVYMVATKETLHKLQLIQNVACRIILKAGNRDSVHDMHKELGLLDLDTRREMNLSFTCHKVVYNEGCSSLSKFFVPLSVGGRRVTRRSNDKNMKVPQRRTCKGRSSFSFRGPNHWNGISNDLKLTEKFKSFKVGYSKSIAGKFVNHPT